MYRFIGILLCKTDGDITNIQFALGSLALISMLGSLVFLFIHAICYCHYNKFTFLAACIAVVSTLICFGFTITLILLGIFVLALCIYVIYYFISNYKKFNKYNGISDSVELDLKTLKELYELNSERLTFWEYRECNYKTDDNGTISICLLNKIEYLKFFFWRHKTQKIEQKIKKLKEEKECNQNNTKATQLVINQALADIKTLRDKAKEELKQADEIQKRVREGMQNDY